MNNLVKTEYYKLRKDRIFWILCIAMIVLAILVPFTFLNWDAMPTGNEFFQGNVLSMNIEIFLRILPVILAGFYLSSEYSNGTMKTLISTGNKRSSIYLSKLLFYTLGSVLLMLILPTIFMGVSRVVLGEEVLPDSTYYFQSVAYLVLYTVAFASIIALLAMIFTDSGKTIGVAFVSMLLGPEILELLGANIEFLRPLTDNTVFALIQNIYRLGELSNQEWLLSLTVPVATIVVSSILGIILFQKKEIK